jgi:5'-methylthioadenosine phosphorylase
VTNKSRSAAVGVFGGSGFYKLLDDVELVEVSTPYGEPSDRIAIGTVAGRRVAFLPRHGSKHTIPPAAINYRANLWAFKELGVERVIGPNAAGSLQTKVKPGDFVVCDQFVDAVCGPEYHRQLLQLVHRSGCRARGRHPGGPACPRRGARHAPRLGQQ